MEPELEINPILTFKTAKGSRYWLDETGRSQRYKFYHKETTIKGQGMQEPYRYIIFVNNEDANLIASATASREKSTMIIRNDKLYIVLSRNKDITKVYGPFNLCYDPQLGLAPIEITNLKYDANTEGFIVQSYYHIGNEIVNIQSLIDW
ncbi:hypothetical protein [Bacillus marasmi]|uniref:hypothetical protein n=1 Tax=Bacillus marasmi TaxID=1926279 RepID=UPI0011C89976|nr:hypothetical protein [Bacillus marasmi]